jgi:hypothetical protein
MASTSIFVYIGGHRHRRGILFGDAYPEEGVRQQATAAPTEDIPGLKQSAIERRVETAFGIPVSG